MGNHIICRTSSREIWVVGPRFNFLVELFVQHHVAQTNEAFNLQLSVTVIAIQYFNVCTNLATTFSRRKVINTFEHDFQRTVMKSLIGLFYVVLEKNNLDMMKCH